MFLIDINNEVIMIEPLLKDTTVTDNLVGHPISEKMGWMVINTLTGDILDKDKLSYDLLGDIKNLEEILNKQEISLTDVNGEKNFVDIIINRNNQKRHLKLTFVSSSVKETNKGIIWVKDDTDKIKFINEINKLRGI